MRKERKTYCIRVQNQIVEVSHEIYTEYYRLRRSEKHLEEIDRENGLIPFSLLESDDHLTEDWLAELTDDIACQFEEGALLSLYLSELDESDRWLIEQLVINDRKQAEIAAELNLHQSTIYRRKKRILRAIKKKILENR